MVTVDSRKACEPLDLSIGMVLTKAGAKDENFVIVSRQVRFSLKWRAFESYFASRCKVVSDKLIQGRALSRHESDATTRYYT